MVLMFPLGMFAQGLDSLSNGASADLQKALAELAQVRQEVESDPGGGLDHRPLVGFHRSPKLRAEFPRALRLVIESHADRF